MGSYPDQVLLEIRGGVSNAMDRLKTSDNIDLVEIVRGADVNGIRHDNPQYFNQEVVDPFAEILGIKRRIPTQEGYDFIAAKNVLLERLGKDDYMALWGLRMPRSIREKIKTYFSREYPSINS